MHSHIFIGLCAAAITAQSYFVVNELPLAHWPFIVLVFFATMGLYSIHRYIQSRAYENIEDERVLTLRNHRSVYILFFILGSAVAALFFLLYFCKHVLSFVWPALLGGLYIIPWTRAWKRFRDLPYLKVFLIIATWVWITLLLPLGLMEYSPDGIGWMALERGAFLLAITLPFDIRDLFADRSIGLKTLATALGVKRVKRLSFTLIIAGMIISFYLYQATIYNWQIFLSYLLTYLVALLLIWRSTSKRTESFYSLGLDGTLLIPALIYLILNFEF